MAILGEFGIMILGAAAGMAAGMPQPEVVTVDTHIHADPEFVWSAVRDVYAVDRRLAPGMVSSVVKVGDDVRIVTFVNGFTVKERIVEIDDQARLLTYSAFGGKASFHEATLKVIPDSNGSRVVWTSRFLPAELRPFITDNMERGAVVMKQHLEHEAASFKTNNQ